MTSFIPFNERGYVSHSSVAAYNNCQTKWFKMYMQGKTDRTSDAQRQGTLWHSMIDMLSRDDNPLAVVDSIMQEEYDTSITQDERNQTENWHAIFSILLPAYLDKYGQDDEREHEYNITRSPLAIKGYIDGIKGNGIVEDKLLNKHFFNATAIASLHTNQQIFLYLWVARELGLGNSLEYRVTLKPTINIRRKQKPETREEFEYRLYCDVRDNPAGYLWSTVFTKSDDQLDAFMKQFDTAMYDMHEMSDSPDPSPTRNTQACSMYGGCTFIKDCS